MTQANRKLMVKETSVKLKSAEADSGLVKLVVITNDFFNN